MNLLQIGPGPRLRGLLAGALGLTLGVLLGCGGGGGGSTPSTPSTPPPAWMTGVWTGTNSATGGLGRVLVLPSGRMMAMDGTTLNQLDGTLSLTGAALSGSATSYQVATSTTAPATFSGTAAQSPASMNLTASANGGSSSFNLTPDSNANGAVTPAQVAGNYTSLAVANSLDQDLTAVVTVSGSGLTVAIQTTQGQSQSFTFKQVASSLNAFTLDTSVANQGESSGLAYYTPAQGTTAASVVVMMNNGQKALQGVFTQAGGGGSASTSIACSGVWGGTAGAGTNITTVVLPSGAFQLFDLRSFMIGKGNLALNGSALSGTGNLFTTNSGAVTVTPVTVGGTYQPSLLDPTLTAAGQTTNGTFTPYPTANGTTPLASLVGTYYCPATGNSLNQALTLNIAADGGFTVATNPASGAAILTGTLNQVAAGLNAFNLALANPQLTGLAYLLPGDTSANDLVVFVLTSDTATFGGSFLRN